MKILLANPRGFCAGVDRAIEIVERALELFGPPIYVRHEVVHNRPVVERLKKMGAIFTDFIEDIPSGSTVIFSAHGVSQAVKQQAQDRRLRVFDATCPLVTKVHMEVARLSKNEIECVLIGHDHHPEVEGTMGQYDNPKAGIYLVESVRGAMELKLKDASRCAYVTQTTLSVTDTQDIIKTLKSRFPEIQGPKKDDICYATQNRQDAVVSLAERSDVVIVVGSPASSNSNRLRELSERMGTPSYLVDDPKQLDPDWFSGVDTIGLTAGASAPETLVQEMIAQLQQWGACLTEEQQGVEETIVFALPKLLRRKAAS